MLLIIFFEENSMVWSNRIPICSDDAAAMTGLFKRFLTLAKNNNSNLITIIYLFFFAPWSSNDKKFGWMRIR